jgi:hypothetical protein
MVARVLKDQPVVEADARDSLATTYRCLGEARLAIPQHERSAYPRIAALRLDLTLQHTCQPQSGQRGVGLGCLFAAGHPVFRPSKLETCNGEVGWRLLAQSAG